MIRNSGRFSQTVMILNIVWYGAEVVVVDENFIAGSDLTSTEIMGFA